MLSTLYEIHAGVKDCLVSKFVRVNAIAAEFICVIRGNQEILPDIDEPEIVVFCCLYNNFVISFLPAVYLIHVPKPFEYVFPAQVLRDPNPGIYLVPAAGVP